MKGRLIRLILSLSSKQLREPKENWLTDQSHTRFLFSLWGRQLQLTSPRRKECFMCTEDNYT